MTQKTYLTPHTTALAASLEQIYTERSSEMLFHGWHHIYFVAKKAVQFAEGYDVNKEYIEAAALTHDLNYLVAVNSEPEVGRDMRLAELAKAGFSTDEAETIDAIIMEEHIATRHKDISQSAKILSDADTLFKALPTTPIVLAGHFIIENQIDIQKLARKIVSEQKPLMEQDIYFYTPKAKEKYLKWAKVNPMLWEHVEEALDDEDVKELLDIARRLDVI